MKKFLKYFLIVIIVAIVVSAFWFAMFQLKKHNSENTEVYTIEKQSELGEGSMYIKAEDGKVKLTIGTNGDNVSEENWADIIPPVFGKEYTITGLTSKVKDTFMLEVAPIEHNGIYNEQVILVLDNGDLKRVVFTKQNRNNDEIAISNEKIAFYDIVKNYIDWNYDNNQVLGYNVIVEFPQNENQYFAQVSGDYKNDFYAQIKYNSDYTDAEVVKVLSYESMMNMLNQENEDDNNPNANNNNVKKENNNYSKANEAIKKVLKDEDWLKSKKLIADMDGDESGEFFKTHLYLIKINDINGNPAYLVRSQTMDSSRTALVTYKNGNVVISKNFAASDYSSQRVDLNKNVIEVVNESVDAMSYYEITDDNLIEIDSFEPEESEQAKEKYKNYNFVEINIELTSANIDKYVK